MKVSGSELKSEEIEKKIIRIDDNITNNSNEKKDFCVLYLFCGDFMYALRHISHLTKTGRVKERHKCIISGELAIPNFTFLPPPTSISFHFIGKLDVEWNFTNLSSSSLYSVKGFLFFSHCNHVFYF